MTSRTANLTSWIASTQGVVKLACDADPLNTVLAGIRSELTAVEMAFMLSTVHTQMPQYRQAEAHRRFESIVSRHGYLNQIVDIATRLKLNINSKQHKSAFGMMGVLDHVIQAGSAPTQVEMADFQTCSECSMPMLMDSKRSDLRCSNPDCGFVSELIGYAIDESPSDSRSKSGQFSPGRHFRMWWTRILALESDEVLGDKSDDNAHGEKLLAMIVAQMAKDHVLPETLTINKIRGLLKLVNQTGFNENAALILKKLSGKCPPVISDEVTNKVEVYFTRVIQAFDQISMQNKGKRKNRSYYPYYIYKILDALLPPSDKEQRKVLQFIYMQHPETVVNNDLEWKKICEIVADPALRYRATVLPAARQC